MGQLFICVLGIMFVVTYGTNGEKDGIGTTKEIETCSVLANRLRDLEKGMFFISQNIQDRKVEHKKEIGKMKAAIDTQNELNVRQREEIVKKKIEIDNLKLEHRFEMDTLKDSWKKLKIHVNKVNQDRLNEEAIDHVNHGENVTSRFQRYLRNK